MAAMLLTCGAKHSEMQAAPLEDTEQTTMQKMYITIDGVTKTVTLTDNKATQALVAELKKAPMTLTLRDGGFEIWGPLPISLPTSNEQISAQAGDVLLWSGNICYSTVLTHTDTPVWGRLKEHRPAN